MVSRRPRLAWLLLPAAAAGFVLALGWWLRPRYEAPAPAPSALTLPSYPWPLVNPHYQPLSARFPPSPGYTRVAAPAGTWAAWLRGLPLRPAGTPVVDEAGRIRLPASASRLGAVVDIDLRPNEQCADIIYRLRAEWLWVQGPREAIRFRATDGSRLA